MVHVECLPVRVEVGEERLIADAIAETGKGNIRIIVMRQMEL